MYYRPKIFFPKKTYSLFGEDLVVKKFFKKNKGIYVDIGAYHPIEGSNTYLLYKKGWSGINIDLSDLSIQLFKITRKKDSNLRLSVGSKEGKKKYFFRKKINMLNTTNIKFAQKNFPNNYQIAEIQQKTLNNIMDKSRFKDRQIDFLNIDVEGNEYNVIKNFKFKKYLPKLICIEMHEKDYQKTFVWKLLKEKNYSLIWKYKYSFIFKLNKSRPCR